MGEGRGERDGLPLINEQIMEYKSSKSHSIKDKV